MIHRLLLSLVFLMSFHAADASVLASCPWFFAGKQPPVLVNFKLVQRTTMLCNDGFAVLASGVTHGALWSAEHPTRASVRAARRIQRIGEFHLEDRLPLADQAQLDDYRGSGYDRGHMTPSGDMPDDLAQQQTFSLANIVPQVPVLNGGVWSKIEAAIRNLADRRGELFVVTGPAFVGDQLNSIGPSGVVVPSSTWKAVYDPRARGAGVYVCTNTVQPRCQVVSVAMLVSAVGINPFPGLPSAAAAQAIALPRPGADRRRNGERRRERRDINELIKKLFQ